MKPSIPSQQVEIIRVGERGLRGHPGFGTAIYSVSGKVVPRLGTHPYELPFECLLYVVIINLWVPPVSGPCIVDVNANGVSVFDAPGDRPSIAIGESRAASGTDVGVFPAGTIFTADVDEGDGEAENLTVQVVLLATEE